MWGSPGISHLNHIIKAAYKHMHTHEKKARRQVKTITINSVSFSFHSSVSAAELHSISTSVCSQRTKVFACYHTIQLGRRVDLISVKSLGN